jgi:hypothetical protein
MKYHYTDANGKNAGPIDVEELQALRSKGVISESSLVVEEGGAQWRKYADLFPGGRLSDSSHAATTVAKQPGAIKVFSILNIVFGAFGLLGVPFILIGMRTTEKMFNAGPAYTRWLVASGIVGLVGGIISIISGVGLYRVKEWARKLAIWYSCFSIIYGVIGTYISILYVMPSLQKNIPGAGGGVGGGIIGGVFSFIYPTLLIYFLSRQKVKDAMR